MPSTVAAQAPIRDALRSPEYLIVRMGPRSTSAQVKCWVLGRTTFRNVLSDSAFKRRRRFGELLDKIKILSGLTCADTTACSQRMALGSIDACAARCGPRGGHGDPPLQRLLDAALLRPRLPAESTSAASSQTRSCP